MTYDLLITNSHIISPHGISDKNIIIDEGKIVGFTHDTPSCDRKINGEGLISIPGPIDTHRITSYNVCYTKLLRMPEFSGIDIIQTLEREKILKDQKIVIFSATAFTTNQINDLLKKEGIHGCLKKPIQP